MSLTQRYLAFVLEWNLVCELQQKIPKLATLCVPSKPLLQWSYRLALRILDEPERINFCVKDLDVILTGFWQLKFEDMSNRQRFLWANAHSKRVMEILLEAQREAQWVAVFFHEQGVSIDSLYKIPLLDWSNFKNPFLNLSIFSSIRKAFVDRGYSWLGFREKQAALLQPLPSLALSLTQRKFPDHLQWLRSRLISLRKQSRYFLLSEFLVQEINLVEDIFGLIQKLTTVFPPSTVDLFRIYLRHQVDPVSFIPFTKSLFQEYRKGAEGKIETVRIFFTTYLSENPRRLELMIEAGDGPGAQTSETLDSFNEVYLSKEKEICFLQRWKGVCNREMALFLSKIRAQKKKWLDDLGEEVAVFDIDLSDGEEETGEVSGFSQEKGTTIVATPQSTSVYKNNYLNSQQDTPPSKNEEKTLYRNRSALVPAWQDHLSLILKTDSCVSNSRFRIIVVAVLRSMLLCSMQHQLEKLEELRKQFRSTVYTIKKIATWLGMETLITRERTYLMSLQKYLDLIFDRDILQHSSFKTAKANLKRNMDILTNYKKRIFIKELIQSFFEKELNLTPGDTPIVMIQKKLQEFDLEVYSLMRDECQKILDSDLYVDISKWIEKVGACKKDLLSILTSWRFKLPSHFNYEEEFDQLLNNDSKNITRLTETFPNSLDFLAWQVIDVVTHKPDPLVKAYDKEVEIKIDHYSKKLSQEKLPLHINEFCKTLLRKIRKVQKNINECPATHDFIIHWIRHFLLFAAIGFLTQT